MFDFTEIERFRRSFDWAFDHVVKLINDPRCTGAYASVGDHTGVVQATFVVRQPWRNTPYHFHAGEKVSRTGMHDDHLTSDESADESQERYGGAFRSNPSGGVIIAVSGLPEAEQDTAVGLLAMCKMGEMSTNFAELIVVRTGGNQYWDQLKHLVVA